MISIKGSFYNTKKIVVFACVGILALLLAGCSKPTATNTSTNNTNTSVPEVSSEDSIKEVLRNFSALNGQRKFGDAYQYVAQASNVTQKDFVDYLSGRGQLVSGFKDISYNYIQVHGDTADTSYTVSWNLLTNSISGGVYNYERQYQMVKEAGNWKILWKKDEDDTSNSNTNSN